MAAVKELSYRIFDELLDAVRMDLKGFQMDGDIDAADLIKVAQRINYELGLRIYIAKETIIDVDHGRAKLPADFHQMLLALVCHHYKQVQGNPSNGIQTFEKIITSGSTSTCDICEVTHTGDCPEIVSNPWIIGKTRSICNNTIDIKILQYCSADIRCYERLERMYIVPSKEATSFCLNTQFRDSHHKGSIHGNFLEGSLECGKIYISYLGALEDDNGNLLVLDHPKINNYYELALQYAVLRNLYIGGDDLIQRVQFVKKEMEDAKYEALSISNTPNYREMVEGNKHYRNVINRKYFNPINKYYGRLGWSIDIDNL